MHALLDTIAHVALPTEACRVFHGRGGLHPGCEHWSLDFYPPVWLLTSHRPTTEDERACIARALQQRWSALAPTDSMSLVLQERGEGRPITRVIEGSIPEAHVVSEGGLRYRVQLLHGQNHCLFLDMAVGRQWVRNVAAARPGLSVLNLFAYTCAFSVVALQGGAKRVVNIDMSAGALATGQHNHRLNGLDNGATFLAHDIFHSWGKLSRLGPYDLVIADPPSYQKGSFVATKDYARVIRRLPGLLASGGHALLCLNAPELDVHFLQGLVDQHAPGMAVIERLPNPTAFADMSADRALKVLVVRRTTG